jgi:hypothetical protein
VQVIPVLVTEDTVFQGLRDKSQSLLFNRSRATATAARPLALLQPGRPPAGFFQDSFSVYPVLEAYQPASIQPGSSAQPFLLYIRVSTRLPELEPEYSRFNHQILFRLRGPYAAQLVGYTFEVPDLNDNPWLEWVHPPKSPEGALYPFRQIPQAVRGQPYNLYFDQPTPWKIEAEVDTVSRSFTSTLLLVYGRPQVYTPPPPPVTFRCRAVTSGWYNGIYYQPGDVFDLNAAADYSDSTVNYGANSGTTEYGWMIQVPSGTPLITQGIAQPIPLFPVIDPVPPKRFVY